jgi:hypothetical protein
MNFKIENKIYLCIELFLVFPEGFGWILQLEQAGLHIWYRPQEGGPGRNTNIPPPILVFRLSSNFSLQVPTLPKCEIFNRSDFHDFYPIKPPWVGDFGV